MHLFIYIIYLFLCVCVYLLIDCCVVRCNGSHKSQIVTEICRRLQSLRLVW